MRLSVRRTLTKVNSDINGNSEIIQLWNVTPKLTKCRICDQSLFNLSRIKILIKSKHVNVLS